MPSKNVKDFLPIQSVDISSTNSLLSVVNGELRRLSAGNLSLLSISGVTGIFSIGTPATPLINNPLTVVGSGNSYIQLNIQNRASGLNASSDLVLTANNGTDSTNFINLGINNLGYNDPAYNNATGLDGYLFIDGGDLDIGTRTPNKIIEFHAGGTTADKVISRIDASGMNMISGTYRIKDVPYNTFTITLTHANDNPVQGNNYFGINDLGYAQAAGGLRRTIPIAETCQIRKASWTNFIGTLGTSSALLSTGYVINTSSIPVQTAIVSTSINTPTSTTPTSYTTTFSPPINVTAGDLIVASLGINASYTVNPVGVRDTVILYCYN